MDFTKVRPAGWRILIRTRKAPDKIGNVYMPDDAKEKAQLAAVVAEVLAMGPLCYRDENKFGPEPEPWCAPGDWIFIGKYAGAKFKIGTNSDDYRIINDDEVVALVDEPDSIMYA